MRKVPTILFFIFVGLSSVPLFVVALSLWLATVWWDPRLSWLHLFTSFWGYLYVWITPAWSVTILGREKLVDRPMVIVSNHQSLLDILVAFRLFFQFKWVSKAEIFKIPLIGWNMVLNRYIPLVRGNKESSHKMLQACEETLRSGSSIYIFPEGTRSKTDEIKAFKPGAFIIAHKMQVPIQAIALNGARDALPKYNLEIKGNHPIKIKVLDPIPYERFAHLSIEETSNLVRNLLIEEVDKLRAAAGQPPAAAVTLNEVTANSHLNQD